MKNWGQAGRKVRLPIGTSAFPSRFALELSSAADEWPVPAEAVPLSGRGIPAGCVAPSSNTASILGRRALPSGRRAPEIGTASAGTGHWCVERASSRYGPNSGMPPNRMAEIPEPSFSIRVTYREQPQDLRQQPPDQQRAAGVHGKLLSANEIHAGAAAVRRCPSGGARSAHVMHR